MNREKWFGGLWKASRKSGLAPEKRVIGILSFEVVSLMSKVVHLWWSLSDERVVRLREEIMTSVGIRKLVSDDDDYLDGLVCAEVMENLRFVVKSVGRIGKKCADPVLQRFENVFDDFMKNDADMFGWEFGWKKMGRKIKKLEKYIKLTSNLYQEIEALTDLEVTLKKTQAIRDQDYAKRIEFQKKVLWKRQEVKSLREVSVWNKTYDYIVLLLARSLVTLFRRINHVFGIHQTIAGDSSDLKVMTSGHLPRSRSISALRQMSVHPAENNVVRFASGPLGRPNAKSGSTTHSGPLGRSPANSGPLGRSTTKSGSTTHSGPLGRSPANSGPLGRSTTKSGPLGRSSPESGSLPSNLHRKPPRLKTKRFTPVGPFKGCMMGGNKSPVLQSFAPVISGNLSGNLSSDSVYSGSLSGMKVAFAEPRQPNNILFNNLFLYNSKSRLLSPPPSTLGASALALHYANIVIVIEKYVQTPHLIGSDARDDLYVMFPTSIKAALRARLKSYVGNMSSSYSDADLAAEWSEAVARIIEWLAPLAHNMIRWQSERGFQQQQQQHLASRTTVLLVQTLFFANQAKTEAAITELLVGLNYLWRFSKELTEKAVRECASSAESDDYLDFHA